MAEATEEEKDMTDEIEGVYVQAWVWVGLADEGGGPTKRSAYTDERVREIAREQHQDWGEVEIDDDAIVSWPAE